MKEELKITLAYLPEEGEHFSGELSPTTLETSETDLASPDGPLFYDLFVQRFEDELLVRGFLETSMKMECSKTGKEFTQIITVEEFATSIEIDSGIMNLTNALREEILIEVPTYPICEEVDENFEHKLNYEYLTVDKTPKHDVNDSSASESERKWSNNWDALDNAKNFPSKEENN
ncbi:DUF177 domain-containing protein [Akkermansiaceae bacterium]|nr:DUF177 domain-containing protein [Akkermansiaceae bacterium]